MSPNSMVIFEKLYIYYNIHFKLDGIKKYAMFLNSTPHITRGSSLEISGNAAYSRLQTFLLLLAVQSLC